MEENLTVLVAFTEDATRFAAESALSDATLDVAYGDGRSESWSEFFSRPADVVVVACGDYNEATSQLVDAAVTQRPDRPVVILTERSPNGSLRPAFEAGADDVLALPQTPESIRFALEKVVARRRGSSMVRGTPNAPLICVLGPKGGTGKTLVATNLAVALARRDQRVVLVDLDLQFGDVGLALGLIPERTVYDLAKAGGPYDHDKIERHLARHGSGVNVLLGPTRPDHASAVTVEFLRDVFASIRTMCDVVIVDTPPGFTPEVIAAIDISTSAVLVGMLDALSLKNTKLGLETLDLMGYPLENIALLLNRSDSRVGITHADVSAIVGRVPDVLVPSDREIPRSVNEGTPIVATRERSEAARAFQKLAEMYTKPSADDVSPEAQARRTLLATRRR